MSQAHLAERIGRAPGTLSKWENPSQEQRPEPGIVHALASCLDVEPSWFFKPLEDKTSTVFFRSLKTELEALRKRTRARIGFVEAIDQALGDHVDLPTVDIPDLLEGRDVVRLRSYDIEGLADELRAHWSLGEEPITDMMLLIENAGVVVAQDEIGSMKLDGASSWSRRTERPYVLLAKDKRNGARRRFDAAHELAHLVLHRGLDDGDLERRFDLIEDQAMALAGAFLMPARAFQDEVFSLSLDALLGLKLRWGVSVGAMIKRLSALGLLKGEAERRLWQYYSQRRWRGREPLDDQVVVEEPQNLGEALRLAVEEGGTPSRAMLREIGLSARDVTDLCGLPDDFFGVDRKQSPPRRDPKLKSPEDGWRTDERSPGGNVVSIGDLFARRREEGPEGGEG